MGSLLDNPDSPTTPISLIPHRILRPSTEAVGGIFLYFKAALLPLQSITTYDCPWVQFYDQLSSSETSKFIGSGLPRAHSVVRL